MEWQPIETAPKDGTVVDLWCRRSWNPPSPFERRTDVYWDVHHARWRTDGVLHYVEETFLSSDRYRHLIPTHWMPRPPSPAETAEADLAAARAARTVKVKPLVWRQTAENAWSAQHYSVHQYWPHNNGDFSATGYIGGIGAFCVGRFSTLDAAKAAAQADYEARILAAIAGKDGAP